MISAARTTATERSGARIERRPLRSAVVRASAPAGLRTNAVEPALRLPRNDNVYETTLGRLKSDHEEHDHDAAIC